MRKTRMPWSGLDRIPNGHTSGRVIEGCLLLEGGAWRGMYTQGVLDALMESDLSFRTTIGVSAGALSAVGYLSGQIGWSARINLTYRHDPNYYGRAALHDNHGVTGFDYLLNHLMSRYPLDEQTFYKRNRELIVLATNLNTGRARCFYKNRYTSFYKKRGLSQRDFALRNDHGIFKAIQASATVPYVSRPVMIAHEPYLDGGCAVKIPYAYARSHFPGKTVVVRTQDLSYRRKPKKFREIDHLLYDRYPAFLNTLAKSHDLYNQTIEKMNRDVVYGETFVLAPNTPVTISRFEGNMEKLGDLYLRGYQETKEKIPALLAYLRA